MLMTMVHGRPSTRVALQQPGMWRGNKGEKGKMGGGNEKKGDRRKETERSRREEGDGKKQTGRRRREEGDGKKETGGRRQEEGDGKKETEGKKEMTEGKKRREK